MSTTLIELHNTLYDWLYSVIPNRTAIASNNNAEVPNHPYLTFGIKRIEVAGNPVSHIDDNDVETIEQRHTMTVGIECVGDGTLGHSCESDIRYIASTLHSQKRYLDLWRVCGFGQIQIQPQNITSSMLGTNRARWNFDFIIHAIINSSIDNADYIENAHLVVIDAENDDVISDTLVTRR